MKWSLRREFVDIQSAVHTWNRILTRSSGATQVLPKPPATPPASSSCEVAPSASGRNQPGVQARAARAQLQVCIMVTLAGGGSAGHLGKQRQLLYAMPMDLLVVRDRSRVLELSADHQSTAYRRI